MNKISRAALLVSIAMTATSVALICAGPLTPPAGSVASTSKSLAEIEPRIALSATNTPGDVSSVFIISQPGSYYLTGDLKPTGGRNGILVNADNVTIDLNGYSLDGSSDSTGFRAGITNSTPRRNVIVRNGTVRNFRGYGAIGHFHTSSFENLTFVDSLGGQLEIAPSSGTTVRNVRTRAPSGETGIQVGTNCTIEGCTVEGGTVGITVASGVVRGCSVLNPGYNGISIGAGVVTQCYVEGANSTASVNNAGINAGNGVRVESCVIKSCAASGVSVAGRVQVVNCQFTSCGKGVSGSGRTLIEGNHFTQCTTAVAITSTNSMIVGNRFAGNTTAINVPAGNTIGELYDFSSGGGTLTPTTGHPAANIVY
jgi:hypothetical protein